MPLININISDVLVTALEKRRARLGLRSRHATIVQGLEELCAIEIPVKVDTRPIRDALGGWCDSCIAGNHCGGGPCKLADGTDFMSDERDYLKRWMCGCHICRGIPFDGPLPKNTYESYSLVTQKPKASAPPVTTETVKPVPLQLEPRRVGNMLSYGKPTCSIHPDDALAQGKPLNDGLDDAPELFPQYTEEEKELMRFVNEAVARNPKG